MDENGENGGSLLIDLCAICHVNPIKYSCPRDGVSTCSLPCVKRHKLWAQCSGVREPFEYRKRSELETAASIDRDFNFITNVERSLQRADDNAAGRGLDLAPARIKPVDLQSKMAQELNARGIHIRRAPRGLSRSKQNKSHWAGNTNCIMWTIEWIPESGPSVINCLHEVKTVAEAFSITFENRGKQKKRKRVTADENQSMLETTASAQRATSSKTSDGTQSGRLTFSNCELANHPPNATVSSVMRHYYLHRPDTEARFRCVVPLDGDMLLHKALAGRTLLEFPTIYIRSEAPEHLPRPFISEVSYLESYGKEIPINVTPSQHAPAELDLEEGEVESESGSRPAHLVEEAVLEVLAKDLGS